MSWEAWTLIVMVVVLIAMLTFWPNFRKAFFNYFDLNKAHERAVKRREGSK
jgi:hypothetical protein